MTMFYSICLLTSILGVSAASDVDFYDTKSYCRASPDKLSVAVARNYVSSHFCNEFDTTQATQGVYIGPERVKLTLNFVPSSNPTSCTCSDEWDWVFGACKFA